MYKYDLWGAVIESDIPLSQKDLEDNSSKNRLKRKLIELKVMIDRTECITGKFIITNGKIRAYPYKTPAKSFKKYVKVHMEEAGKVPVCYELDLNNKSYNPIPIYSLDEDKTTCPTCSK